MICPLKLPLHLISLILWGLFLNLTIFFNISEHLSIHGLWNDDEIFKLCWIFNNDYNDNNNNHHNNNNTNNRGHIGSRFDSRKQCSYIISSYHSYCISLLLSELKSGPWARACGQKQKIKKNQPTMSINSKRNKLQSGRILLSKSKDSVTNTF